MPSTSRLSWRWLTQREPRLLALYNRARSLKDPGSDRLRRICANDLWAGDQGPVDFRARLNELVGWYRKASVHDPETEKLLRTQEAWQIAQEKIYDALPNCRGCDCVAVGDWWE